MASHDVKMEDGGYIKTEPDAAQESTLMEEDDAFEDTGELELPQQLQSAWLLRLPRYLHEKWASLDMDSEIQLGTVRRYKKSGKQQLVLNQSMPLYEKVPKVFDVEQTDQGVRNTYFFSEKDLPGYRKGSNNKQGGHEGAGRGGSGRVDKNSRSHYSRRVVPKQTALRGAVTHEFNLTAAENPETAEIIKERVQAAEHKRPRVDFMGVDPRLAESMSLNRSRERSNFDNFLNHPVSKNKPQENKAARIPRNELLDKLFKCFERYKYWSLKALRRELDQPEVYLKENLEAIAELVRSGPSTGQYQLRADVTQHNYAVAKDGDVKDEEKELESALEDDDDVVLSD